MHQNTGKRRLTEALVLTVKPACYSRKLVDGAGLHLLIMPNDHRYWHYQYRFEGKQNTLALGVYPYVSLQVARGRHRFARRLLADGIDPSTLKRTLGKRAFARAAQEWLVKRHQRMAKKLAKVAQ
jgi:hypothetical protein